MDEPSPAALTEMTVPNPQRVVAGRRNRKLRRGLTEAGRTRLREAALRNRPSQFSTGPKTAEGRQQAARNGRKRQSGELSARQCRALFGFLISRLGPLKNLRVPSSGSNQTGRKKR